MDEPNLNDWVDKMLKGNIHAARVRVSKASKALESGSDKVAQLKKILEDSGSIQEARGKARQAGLLDQEN